ncbi:hypothetical protein [Nostoc sphaeroides]|uniref:Monooxygenase n=1 Tax=Nostoc sphaeroides CCNUC1 TaxID=2653204 RepID=A0A5P8WBQ5_9NOSO|nr:hypothetical protein [Nostoc sphaeroides]QFS50044.1 monooxygenase [Nostoc sphaeroides CCNUC1]
MVQLLVKQESKHWINVATSLSTELAATAVERDNKAGLPDIEIQRLRETGLSKLVWKKPSILRNVNRLKVLTNDQ